MLHLFFELLQVAVGNRTQLSTSPTSDEWEQIYRLSKEHTLTGICFAALEKLPAEQLPPPSRIRQWAFKANRIRQTNTRISKQSAWIYHYFKQHDINCLILKGQGNMSYYPDHFKGLREPGDIDAWVWTANKGGHYCGYDAKEIISFCQSKCKSDYIYYHNMDFPIFKDTPVEVHYRPSWLYTPWRNKRLQRWFEEQKLQPASDYENYKIPLPHFNIIFQLLHIYKHIFEEGIGLRQLLDYYLLLTKYSNDVDKTEIMALLNSFGLKLFATAVMYVLQTVFSPNDTLWQLCEPDTKEGERLLREIVLSGNFGKHDKRYDWANATNGSMKYRGMRYALTRLRHNYQFLRSYTLEVLFEPFFRFYNKLWLLSNNPY